MNESNTEEQLTPEQAQVKIAEYQSVKATAEADREKVAEERRQQEAQIRESNAGEVFKAALARTGIRFYMEPSELQTVLKVAGFAVTPSTTGDALRVLDADGNQVTVETALEKIAVVKPYLVRSGADHLRPRDESTGEFTKLCRDDFGNNLAAKSRWISEHPGEFEKLPQHRAPKVQETEMTAAQYRALSIRERSRIISEVGEIGIQQILRRK